MTHHSGAIEIRKQRGRLVVNGIGRTPRGQKFIAKQVKLTVKDMGDPAFKSEMASAVNEILGREA